MNTVYPLIAFLLSPVSPFFFGRWGYMSMTNALMAFGILPAISARAM